MASSAAAPPAPATSGTPPERHRPAWLLTAIVFAAVLAAYLPVWHAGFIWDPANAIAHYNLGAASLLLGRRAEAKAESEAALHLRPDPGQARASLEQLDHDR